MNLVMLASFAAIVSTAAPNSKTAAPESFNLPTQGICYDEYFCHGEEIPELRDQSSCLNQGGSSWWNTESLNCSTLGR